MSLTDAKQTFKDRVLDWAAKLDVNVVWLGVRPMRNQWASCPSSGHFNFSNKLLDADTDAQDSVIVHELLQSHVPNHGKLWKSLMRTHLGQYEASEAKLRSTSVRL